MVAVAEHGVEPGQRGRVAVDGAAGRGAGRRGASAASIRSTAAIGGAGAWQATVTERTRGDPWRFRVGRV